VLILITTSILGCSKITPGGGNKNLEDFDTFLDQIFITEVQKDALTLNYSLAKPENYGIVDPEITLGHYSVDYIEDTLVSSENYLAALKQYDYESLTDTQKLTYDIFKKDLELDLKLGNFILYNEGLGPTTGIQAQLPVLLAEYNFYDKEDVETYLKLLPQVFTYFEEICAFEKEKSKAGLFMSNDVVDNIVDQCESFIEDKENNYLIEIFNDKIKELGFTEKEIKTYKKANKDAILNQVLPAYELLITTLNSLKGTGTNNGGLCNFEKGKEYYEYLIKVNTGTSKSMSELKTMLDSTISTNMIKLSTIMTKDTDVYDTVMSLTYSLTDPSEIIDYLKKAIQEDFPPSPNVNYSIKYVHKSLQEHLSPAMYLIPAIDDYKNNIIYINNNPEYDLSQIFTTIAHEGYPGHLYQSVYFREQKPAAIRNLLSFGGYVEGWATYVEYYSYHLAGFRNNVADFLEANMAANMALYCRLDIGIHYDGWTLSDTASYLKGFGITDSTTVKLLYTTMLEEPALYPQYGVGYLEIMDLKKTAEDELGDKFVLKEFHKFLLDIGPAQFSVIGDRLKEWINTQKN
jgi:uncharacterized protein (DUF885 family)